MTNTTTGQRTTPQNGVTELSSNHRLFKFFNETISNDEFANITRRFVFESMNIFLKEPPHNLDSKNVSNGFYWLTQLSEILDPQMTKKTHAQNTN